MSQLKLFVVIEDLRVIFEADTLSAAIAWRDGFGNGDVAEVLSKAQEKVSPRRGQRKSKTPRKAA